MFEQLDNHDFIGWDFDGTLIDNDFSEEMHAYIIANPQKTHMIVTFRDPDWAEEVWDDLKQYPGAPTRRYFKGVLAISNKLVENFAVDKHSIRTGKPLPRGVSDYLEWKGRACSENGLTVLVDDLEDMVIHGCRRYGVHYVDSKRMGRTGP